MASLSWQGLQIGGDGFQVPLVQIHGRHKGAGLDGIGIVNPELEIFVGVVGGTGGDGFAAHEVSEIRAEAAIGDGAGDRMAIDASSFFEDVATGSDGTGRIGNLFLGGNPFAETFWRINVDAKEHLGVLSAAVLGTLADVHAGFVWFHPHGVDAIGDQVGLAGELRNPETVVGVSRTQGDERRGAMRRIADGNVELVGGDDTKRRITEFPPELMTDGGDLNSAGRRHSLLNGMDNASGGEEKNQNDKDGDNRPGQFHLIAAIDLGWFAAIFRGAVTELPHGVDEERKDDDKDQSGNDEDEERKPVNQFGGSGRRLEDIRNGRSLGERETGALRKNKSSKQRGPPC